MKWSNKYAPQKIYGMPRTLTVAVVAAVMTQIPATSAYAQQQRGVDISGYHAGAGLNTTLLKFDDGSDLDYGVGVNIDVGVNFNSRIGFFLSGTGAAISADVDGLTLGHADLGVRFSMPAPGSALVPYAELAFTYLTAEHESGEKEVEYSGKGGTGAFGFNYFVTQTVAFDTSIRFTKGKFNSVRVDGKKVSDGEGLTTGRINVGLAWFPKGKAKSQ